MTSHDSQRATPPPPPPIPLEVWCAGLPYVGERSLTVEERDSLTHRARLMRFGAVAAYLLSPVCMLLLLVAILPLESRVPLLFYRGVVFSALVVSFAGGATVLLIGRDLSRRSASLRKTRKLGFVRGFEGAIGWHDPTDVTFERLFKEGFFDPQRKGSARLELLPHSDELYGVDGRPVRRQVPVNVTTAATAPEEPTAYDVPRMWMVEGATGSLERRRPSPQESDEIASYVRTEQGRRYVAMLALTLIGPLSVVMHMVGLSQPAAAALAAVMVAGGVVWRMLRVHRFAKRLRVDADLGWIFISPTFTEPLEGGEERQPGPRLEFLPATKLIWTIDGKPAAWRNAGDSRRR